MLWDRASYWVADTIEQVKDYYKDMIEDPTESFIISVVVVKKEDETSHGWRRRHKRWPYIGTKNPMQEYLYNEDDSITQAVCFHIYRITEFI